MKRQALGKGLGALIPDKKGIEALESKSAADISIDRVSRNETDPPPMSAADIARAARVIPTGVLSAGPLEEAVVIEGRDAPQPDEPIVMDPETFAISAVSAPVVRREAGDAQLTNLQWIDIDRIRPNRFQPRRRFQDVALDELAASIRATGILQPIIVRREGTVYELVAGERRWRAAQRAGLHKVPALVREIPDDRLLETALIENIQRQELNPIEEARAYSTLIEKLSLTQAQVAERVGRERSSIANFLRLLSLSEKVQGLVEEGTLTMGHARALAGMPGAKAQELAAELIVKKGMSVRETEAWVSRHTSDPSPPRQRPKLDPNVAAAEKTLQQELGTMVRIQQGRGGKGRILIEFYSDAELDRLYSRLTKP